MLRIALGTIVLGCFFHPGCGKKDTQVRGDSVPSPGEKRLPHHPLSYRGSSPLPGDRATRPRKEKLLKPSSSSQKPCSRTHNDSSSSSSRSSSSSHYSNSNSVYNGDPLRRDKCPSFHEAARAVHAGEFESAGSDGHIARSAQARRRNRSG